MGWGSWLALFATALCGWYTAGRLLDARRRHDRITLHNEKARVHAETADLLARAQANVARTEEQLELARGERRELHLQRRALAAERDVLHQDIQAARARHSVSRDDLLVAASRAYARLGLTNRRGLTNRLVDVRLIHAVVDEVMSALGIEAGPGPAVAAVAAAPAVEAVRRIDL